MGNQIIPNISNAMYAERMHIGDSCGSASVGKVLVSLSLVWLVGKQNL